LVELCRKAWLYLTHTKQSPQNPYAHSQIFIYSYMYFWMVAQLNSSMFRKFWRVQDSLTAHPLTRCRLSLAAVRATDVLHWCCLLLRIGSSEMYHSMNHMHIH